MASFKQRVDAIQKGMADGTVGCGFVKKLARRGGIEYAQAPQIQSIACRNKYIAVLKRFALDQRKRALVLVPTDEPKDFNEGKELTLNLFAESDVCLGSANFQLMTNLKKSMPEDHPRQAELLELALDQAFKTDFDIFHTVHHPQNIDTICNGFVVSGIEPQLFDVRRVRMQELLSMVVAPYYTPLTDMPHARWSPYYAYIMNYWADIDAAIAKKKKQTKAVVRWSKNAVGFNYAKGLHIDHPPQNY